MAVPVPRQRGSFEAIYVGTSGDQSRFHRIDQSHRKPIAQPAPMVAPAPGTLSVLAGSDSAVSAEQLQRQAGQLGQRLRSQLREIDTRESTFHARVARMENELRTARLVYREREHSIEDRRIDFERRLQKLNARVAGEGEDDLEGSETKLATLPPSMMAEFQPGAIPTAVPISEDSESPAAAGWRKRLHQLDAQENLLKSRLASIAAQQQDLDQSREELDRERVDQANQIRTDRKQVHSEFDRERMKLRNRADELECRSVAVQKMQSDTEQMYREAIELRLCTEGLIGQLHDKISPAEISQRLSALRRQLDDQYQLASQSLKAQQREIEQLILKLTKQESRMSEQRDEVRGWVQRRQLEIEEQATKLLEREQQLSHQEASFRTLEREWKQQRSSYEQEIRRLKRMVAA